MSRTKLKSPPNMPAENAMKQVAAPRVPPPADDPASTSVFGKEAGEAPERGIGIWLSNRRINALWSNTQPRNSWASVTGASWLRLAPDSDSAVTALTILAAHAKQTQSRVNCQTGADGTIKEIYVW